VRGALAFLTIAGRGTVPDRRSLVWFGPVGLVIGACCGLVRWGAGNWWNPFLAAAITLAVDLALTGMLHLDGLADSADGLLSTTDRARRLEIMSSPELGAFALGTVGVTLLVRWSALATIGVRRWDLVLLLAGIWCGARTAMVFLLAHVPYARPGGGLASVFVGQPATAAIVVGAALAVGAAMVGDGWPGLAAVALGTAAAAAVAGLAVRRLGGFTGDVLGAAGVLFETVALLVAAAHW
jgi:adenosylcobinamide-GDP ribazoletransferase